MIRLVRYPQGRLSAVFLLAVVSVLIQILWLHDSISANSDARLVHRVSDARGGKEEPSAPRGSEAQIRARHEQQRQQLMQDMAEKLSRLEALSPRAEAGALAPDEFEVFKGLLEDIPNLRRTLKEAESEYEKRFGRLKRAKVFLAAGDYRRAVDACLFQVWERPSVESYVYLTYVYHAIDGYLERLAKTDRWVAVQHLYLNLAARGAEDLIDPPSVLTRMAKEIIQGAVREQSDVTAAMATRLDKETTERLWKQQSAWRAARPDDWWAGVPESWGW